MSTRNVTLDDKYALEVGASFMTGIQALVRLPLDQVRRDRRKGLRIGCMVSGYEGSPLGGYDLALQRATRFLRDHDVRFVPGVNEELALATVMGSQHFGVFPNPRYDGAVGIWYGKGPGLDRCGDALRHANFSGTGKSCGALALVGDDHVSKSSTIPHQSEFSLYNCAVPVLNPSDIQDVLDFGLYGIAMSRYTGAWTGLKLSTDCCDGGGTVEFGPHRCEVEEPEFRIDGEPYRKAMGLMLVVPYSLSLEAEVHEHRLQAARHFAWANGLNRVTVRHATDRLGIVTTGKSHADLMAALRILGAGDEELRKAGVRILKLGMSYPLEPRIVTEFGKGLETVVVVEEKRSFVELQLRELLYDWPDRPAIYGKKDSAGETLLPSQGELDPGMIAAVLRRFLGDGAVLPSMPDIPAETSNPIPGRRPPPAGRTPSYCSGCPHNRSTLLLEGQVAGGGIGCHGMAGLMRDVGRGIEYLFQMGSEGASWIGASPFTGTKHMFQNIGDGTYFHSGRLAVQAAVAAGVNITFKILYNDVVAMTGGQNPAGALPVPALTRELEAQGIRKIVVLSDDPRRYQGESSLAATAEYRPREELEEVLRDLEQVKGVSVMLYDQLCAAEKRRRRNRGLLPQPTRRILINERVCEGCGDCVTQSNCVSLLPVETEYGPKTRVHQSSCNADYTCAWGDCPSFVTVEIEAGSGLRRRQIPQLPELTLPEPQRQVRAGKGYHILMPGIGGTGVVTVNALLATAAWIDGLHAITLDQTGVAQKGGAVVAHITISEERIESSQRIPPGSTDLVLGFDLVGAAFPKNLECCSPQRTTAVVNSKEILTGEAIRKGLTVLSPDGGFLEAVRRNTCRSEFVNASMLAETLFGGHIFSNMLLLGVAYQRGVLPLSAEAVHEAIRLNGVAVERNLEVFAWGRQYASDPSCLDAYLPSPPRDLVPLSLEAFVEARERELTAYQNKEYARQYREFVNRVQRMEESVRPGTDKLARAVAWNLHKLMAYKDEYEVARLLLDPDFESQVEETFERPKRFLYHLHPPALRQLGLRRKLTFGPWVRPLLKALAAGKVLRGSWLDPFGWMPSRRQEQALVEWYRGVIDGLLKDLDATSIDLACEIAEAPRAIRGYEEVKRQSVEQAKAWVDERLGQTRTREAA